MGKASKIKKNLNKKIKEARDREIELMQYINNMKDNRSYQLKIGNTTMMYGAFMSGKNWKKMFT